MGLFKKAERKKAHARIAVLGPSGSGKTYSALILASGLTAGPEDKIAVICTEHGAAELYAGREAEGLPDFDVANMSSPYSMEKYIRAIKAAGEDGYAVLIVDSLSHAWAGEGGALSEVDKRSSDRGGKFGSGWKHVTPLHNKLIETILSFPGHLIGTMRSKMQYALNGSKVTKIGMGAVQRDGMEYEFTCVVELSIDNKAEFTKDRTSIFQGKVLRKLEKSHGASIRDWLAEGAVADAPKVTKPVREPVATSKGTLKVGAK